MDLAADRPRGLFQGSGGVIHVIFCHQQWAHPGMSGVPLFPPLLCLALRRTLCSGRLVCLFSLCSASKSFREELGLTLRSRLNPALLFYPLRLPALRLPDWTFIRKVRPGYLLGARLEKFFGSLESLILANSWAWGALQDRAV